MMRVLLIEDEEGFVRFMEKGLTEEGYSVTSRLDGESGFRTAMDSEFDAIILDIMIPKIDGLTVLKKLRHEEGNNTPVIMLTAKGEINDKLKAFELGCDDYIAKPFSFEELLARLRAIAKRAKPISKERIEISDLVLDPTSHKVTRAGKVIDLTKTEFSLLEYLLRNVNHALSRGTILSHVWDYAHESNTNLVDVHIKALRGKVDAEGSQSIIKTVRGIGYMIEK